MQQERSLARPACEGELANELAKLDVSGGSISRQQMPGSQRTGAAATSLTLPLPVPEAPRQALDTCPSVQCFGWHPPEMLCVAHAHSRLPLYRMMNVSCCGLDSLFVTVNAAPAGPQ